jgi:PAS domain S-box-containing protein
LAYREAEDGNAEDFYISPRVQEVFGYRVDEWTWTPSFWRDRIHPEDRERVVSLDHGSNLTHQPYAAEYRFRRADGSYLWVHDEATLVERPDAQGFWQGFLLDITQRKEAEAALEAEESTALPVGGPHRVTPGIGHVD